MGDQENYVLFNIPQGEIELKGVVRGSKGVVGGSRGGSDIGSDISLVANALHAFLNL